MHSSARIVSLRVASLAVILFLWESTAGGVFSSIDFLDTTLTAPVADHASIIRSQSGLLSRDLLVYVGGLVHSRWRWAWSASMFRPTASALTEHLSVV